MEATGFSYDIVCQTLIREYFTNGYLLRDEIVQAFKDFPEVITILESLKRNVAPHPVEEEPYTWNKKALATNDAYELMVDTHASEVAFVKALFGRDVIGKYNQKVVNSL